MSNRPLSRKACVACASAKRKCGRQMPHCARCSKHTIHCVYPPAKPSNFVPIPDPVETEDHDMLISSQEHDGTFLSTGTIDAPGYSPHLNTDCTTSSSPSCSSWALLGTPNNTLFELSAVASSESETWTATLPTQKRDISASTIDHMYLQVNTVLKWLEDWVEKGSNPFIHHRLYRDLLPECIQDAYTALTGYVHRNDANKHLVLRIIENRAKKLIAEQPSVDSLDSFHLLARVQALLVYQLIGLFDGDIRLRQVAESHLDTLYSWGKKMADPSRHPVVRGAEFTGPNSRESGSGVYRVSGMAMSESGWLSYVLSESMQRTWILASGMQGVYKIAQLSRPSDCSGAGMIFTTRRGIWEAPSAFAWEKATSGVDIGLVRMEEVDDIFDKYSINDVDEYAVHVLSIMFGAERMERWKG